MDFSFLIILGLLILLGPYIVAFLLGSRLGRLDAVLNAARHRIGDLEVRSVTQDREIAALRSQVLALRAGQPDDAAAARIRAEDAAAAPQISEPAAAAEPGAVSERDEEALAAAAAGIAPPPEAPALPPVPSLGERLSGWLRAGGLERQFGAVLPVWIGGIALAFAGFFLVKYSIENALIGPEMRTVLGGMLGIGLIVAAHWVGGRSRVESAGRIAQSLAGAGIAVLYVSSYAASALYELVPPLLGFIAMAGVTAVAVVLSLRHGPPIALLGLLGGFLTPALIHSDNPSAMMLFLYLYVVFAALMIIVRRKGWWLLALPALLLSFLWVIGWMVSDAFRPDETLWAGLFLAAVSGTIVAASRERYSAELAEAGSWRGLISLRNRAFFLNTVALAGAFGLMAVLAFNADFNIHDWVLFGLLAVGAVALATFEPRLYGYAPWAAMAVNLLMLAGWEPETAREVAIAVTAFGALYVLSGLLLFPSAPYPLLWAGLSVTSAVGYYLLAWFKIADWDASIPAAVEAVPAPRTDGLAPLQSIAPPLADAPAAVPPAIDTPPRADPVEPLVEGVRDAASAIPHIWGVTAFLLALVFFGAALRAMKTLAPSAVKDRVLAAFALGTTAFVALGFAVELPGEFLSVAIAAELLAVAWVSGRTQIPALRPIAGLLALAFAFLLLPQILLLAQLALYSLLDWRLYWQETVPIVDYPLLQLALPAGFFLGAAWLLRREADGRLVRLFELASVALIALWGYYTTSQLFHPGENVLFARATFLERGVITNVLFLFGLACLIAGRRGGRIAFSWSGALLVALSLFRLAWFDLFLKNPMWTHDAVPGVFLANALAVTFLLPVLWSWFAMREMGFPERPWIARLRRWMPALMLALGFAWLSLEIRRLYQGRFLHSPDMSDAELYTYSAVWLVAGLGLLFFGTLRGSQMLRFASLAVMLATVSKVFLIDAGSLTGLFRVFSFFGLGISLIGLSYFYSRFVFGGSGGGEAERTAEAGPAA
jgi:uncharacterized membrane protein